MPLNTFEAAAYLSLHPKVVSEKARTGEIPAYKKFGQWYFFENELDECLKSNANLTSQEATHDTRSKKTCLVKPLSGSIEEKGGAVGTTRSPHQVVKEYDNLLGLTTSNKLAN